MKKENIMFAGNGAPTGRFTRARAAACQANDGVIPLPIAKPDKKQAHRRKAKRAALDENSQVGPISAAFQNKKRAVLKDATNICCESSYRDCINAARMQSKASQHIKLGSSKVTIYSGTKESAQASTVSVGNALDDAKNKRAGNIQEVGMLESQGTTTSLTVEEALIAPKHVEFFRGGESICKPAVFEANILREGPALLGHSKNGLGVFTGGNFIDIDSDNANPQLCGPYASDIYSNLLAAELIRRPCSNFMETLQRDITQSMRGILVDWLVEVSEEYRLVPDTLYLTVYIIDRFLSENYIERQRLQLLGISCMLIASKYEEICAPRVEEFCFITDNTYTKGEVLKMESQVLKYLAFQLSVPTIKTFLRRFLRAAQASSKVPSLTLGYLANYLAELTLVEYSFLKFNPSVIAASAIFLARWTIDQSDHPWNPTLEHYTIYKASDLKATVLAIQELQNSKKCPLNSIREKYKQQKFESVAALMSPKLLQTIFG